MTKLNPIEKVIKDANFGRNAKDVAVIVGTIQDPANIINNKSLNNNTENIFYQIHDLYNICDIFLLPTKYEIFGIC